MSRPRPTEREARQRLGMLWILGAAISFALLLVMTVGGAVEGREKEAWAWYLPNVVPTLSLILAVYGADRKNRRGGRRVERFYYRLAGWVSAGYLALLLFTFVAWPLSRFEDPLEWMNLSSLWLGPLQGVTAATLGWFFVHELEGD